MTTLTDLEPYIEWGWPIFPIFRIENGRCICRKGASCDSPGKHPMIHGGHNNASADPVQILAWFNSYPRCNWGVATGDASGVWVLDIDQHNVDGAESMRAWQAEQALILPATFTVYTGGGGWHLYFLMEGAIGNATNVLPGVDVRGTGGYVLLPRSNHISGREYITKVNVRPAVASRVLLDLVTRPASSGPRGSGVSAAPSTDLAHYLNHGFTPGNRDVECYHLACSLWRKYWNDPDVVEAAIADCWRATAQGDKPFPWSQAMRKITEARKFIGRKKDEEDEFIRLHGGTT